VEQSSTCATILGCIVERSRPASDGTSLSCQGEVYFIYMKVVRLLLKYASPAIGGYAKMSLSYTIKVPNTHNGTYI
jgi:hypothetical protein